MLRTGAFIMKREKSILIIVFALMAVAALYIANEAIYAYRTNKTKEKLCFIKRGMTQTEVIDILGSPNDEKWIDASKLKDDVGISIMNQEEVDKIINTHKLLLQYSYCISQRRFPLFLRKAVTTCIAVYFEDEAKKVILITGSNIIWD
jgi:hypothetical protein